MSAIAGAAGAAIAAIERVIADSADSADSVIRSLWDDSGGHSLRGVLVEGRYRIADVLQRTRVRSRVLAAIVKGLRDGGINFASPMMELRGNGVS